MVKEESNPATVTIVGTKNSAEVSNEGALHVDQHRKDLTLTKDIADASSAVVFLEAQYGKTIHITAVYVSSNTKTTDVTLQVRDDTHPFFKLYTTNFSTGSTTDMSYHCTPGKPILVTCEAATFVALTYDLHDD